ncbi:Membrane protein involved in the export of O-antigen and teichoic acid [Candidatus Electrothrix marina]|uniref:Membrane protein involved in the export of O-antigen and teichoic acid n=1 Tax=Candidatus Electrothrix marina TaxID=1859130 RepID=A0A3S3UDQ6_9BACT|nr:Membrane protein involved in the export of O-antigen and teichoic acid [Candidatus Electrothrix marina]
MSLKKNILANYVSQFSIAIIGVIMMPMYIKYMGVEAYGLVGFYIMIQAWTQLLDMGMTPTLLRETARYRGGGISLRTLRQLTRTLETIFFCFSFCIALIAFHCSNLVAKNWLNVEHLPLKEVQLSIILIVFAVLLRWISNLYRGIISGAEKFVWLAVYNTSISIARFIVILPVILWVNNGPVAFFTHQFLISLTEIILLKLKSRRLYLQDAGDEAKQGKIFFFHWKSLRSVLKFSSTIAFTTSIWAIVTQADKLILSKILTLTDYAYFTLAVLASSCIMLLSGTTGTALMPRFSKLNFENRKNEITVLYRLATLFTGALSIPVTLALIFFTKPILFIWTGDVEIAINTEQLLSLYSIGNGLLVFNSFPYYLQYANGNLKFHFLGSILFALFFLPLLFLLSFKYGVIGAGWSWLTINLIFFIAWIPYIHSQLYPKLHLKWLFNDILPSLAYCLPVAFTLNYFIIWPSSRTQTFFILLTSCIILLCSTMIPLLFSLKIIKLSHVQKQYEKYFAR